MRSGHKRCYFSDRPPRWRPLFSFIGFCVAVVWIYALANEVVALLKVFGVALGFSDAILGLTLLAWGNSISDLVADVAVARRGFPRMGFFASFGGPLFNLLLGIGLPYTVVFARNGWTPVAVILLFLLKSFGAEGHVHWSCLSVNWLISLMVSAPIYFHIFF